MQQGIAKGGLKRPEDAKLHLGIAQLVAGDNAKAQATLRTVGGSDGTADLARLWELSRAERLPVGSAPTSAPAGSRRRGGSPRH